MYGPDTAAPVLAYRLHVGKFFLNF